MNKDARKNAREDDDMRAESEGPASKNGKHGLWQIILGIIIVILIVYLALPYINATPKIQINGTTSLDLQSAPELIVLNSTTYSISLASYNANTKTAYVYLTEFPPFINPEYNITLTSGIPVRVNIGSGIYANMLLALSNGSATSAEVDITPIASELQERPNSSYIKTVNTSLQSYTANSENRGTKPGNVTVTSVATTTVATTTIAATTTVQQAQNTSQSEVLALLKEDNYYPVMLNYSTDYAESLNCTANLYNTTYYNKYGKSPSAIDNYANVSKITPYALNYTIMNSSNGIDSITYRSWSGSPATTGTAFIVNVNTVSKAIINSTLPLAGVFGGSNLTQLKAGLKSVYLIGNACGIDVVAAP